MNFHLRNTLSSIRRSPFRALAAVFVLTTTFFLGTILSVLIYSSAKVLTYFETRPQVIAFLKDEATVETIAALQHQLSADSRVKEVRYVTKEEALSIYKKATVDNPLLGELVSPSIFPASLEFSLSDLSYAQEVISQVKEEAIVESVGFTASLGGEKTLEDVVGRLRKATFYLRLGGGVLVGVLAVCSFIILVIVMSIRLANKKEEIEILKLIGAKTAFIKSPILIESLLFSWVGVLVGWLLTLILILYLAPSLIAYFGQIPVLPKEPLSFFGLFGVILAVEIILGSLLAVLGSNLALSRARKVR